MDSNNQLCIRDVEIRYFAYNCLEIKLPDGKTLVIDPCIKRDGKYGCGYDENIIDGCDYVLINHAHWDHTLSLGELYNRFHPIIMAHSETVFDLATFFDIPYMKMIPFVDGDVYDYDSFKVEILRARHNPAKMFMVRPSGFVDNTANDKFLREHLDSLTEVERKIENLGSIFNNNFLITLPNNVRLGLFAGNPGMIEPEDKNLWQQLRPDILFAHRAPISYDNWAERMANNLAVSGARIMVPIHIEDNFLKTIDPYEYIAQINNACERMGILGRALYMERAEWYQFSTKVCRVK